MSTMTPSELFRMSCRNGLDMSYDQWRGYSVNPQTAARLPLSGGFLVISPGYDFALGTGIASGLQGNFVIQATLRVNKPDPAVAVVPQVYIMTINSGFFSTLAGSSRILRNLLTEADILGSKPAPEGDRASIKRMIGGGFLSSLGSVLSKAKSYYDASKPLISAVKGDLPEGAVKSALGAVGYGKAGAGGAGAGKKSLAMRLM